MLEHGRLGTRQLATLTIMMVVGDMMMIFPSVITSYAKQDAWMCALIGIPLGMGLMAMFLKLGNAYPNQNLISISRSILGYWPGTLVSIFYLYFFIIGAATHTREVGDFMTTQIFQTTPIRVVILLFTIAIVWAVLHGIETLGRTSEILLPLVIVFIVVLVVSLLPQVDVENLKPYKENSYVSLAQGILVSIIYPIGEAVPILMLLPYTINNPHRNKDIILAAGIGSLILSSLVTISMLVLGAFLTQHNIYASFTLSQKINIGDFFQRIEAFMASAWLISTYFKASIYLYIFVLGTAELFNMKQYRRLILPTGLLIFGLSNVIAPGITYIIITIVPYWVDWDTTIGIIFPGMLLTIHWIKSHSLRKQT
ncbi:spore germination protein KB [Paenibacillus amylolyticus]|uniref:Spore germination protein KB n=1 Tax=Paenibacillus amylolyticus TaxID=1451 RepID=A0AAP5LPY4_PAEAM|nr:MULTISPECIES: endospore germination permease [Paenibacillus]MDR6726771.1 spore germination protein KB [Paenibacillus amylolyticus]